MNLLRDFTKYDICPMTKPNEIVSAKYEEYKKKILESNIKIEKFGWHVVFVMPIPKSWKEGKKKKFNNTPHKYRPQKNMLEKNLFEIISPKQAEFWDGRVSKIWGYEGAIYVRNKAYNGFVPPKQPVKPKEKIQNKQEKLKQIIEEQRAIGEGLWALPIMAIDDIINGIMLGGDALLEKHGLNEIPENHIIAKTLREKQIATQIPCFSVGIPKFGVVSLLLWDFSEDRAYHLFGKKELYNIYHNARNKAIAELQNKLALSLEKRKK